MVIDSLLALVEAQGAEGLVLTPDQPPKLDKGGALQALSMPGLDADMMEVVHEEVTSPQERETLGDAGVVETRYRGFIVRVERRDTALRLAFRLESAAAKPDAAPEPSAPVQPAPAPAVAPLAAAATPHPAAFEPAPAAATPVLDSDRIRALLARTEHERASDLLLVAGQPAWMRVHGQMVPIDQSEVTDAELLGFFAPTDADRAELSRVGSVDNSLSIDGGRYRVNLFKRDGGLTAAVRPIGQRAPTLIELNLPEDLYRLTAMGGGLVLMTGAAGSGKSTTLVSLIEQIHRTSARHIITLEDPIEYVYAPGRSVIHQREIGRDVPSFSAGLRACLREAPDVILVGEMRDRETIAAALTAAETGHLVLSTLHCGSAASAVDRIIDVFEPHQQDQVRSQLAGSLRAVVTQFLLPSTRPPLRVPAYEVLMVNTPVAAKIRESRGYQIASEIQRGRADGMISLEQTLAGLLRSRMITLEVARSVATDPDTLDALRR